MDAPKGPTLLSRPHLGAMFSAVQAPIGHNESGGLLVDCVETEKVKSLRRESSQAGRFLAPTATAGLELTACSWRREGTTGCPRVPASACVMSPTPKLTLASAYVRVPHQGLIPVRSHLCQVPPRAIPGQCLCQGPPKSCREL